MANQTPTRPHTRTRKADENVVYRVMLALACLVFSIYMIQFLGNRYMGMESFFVVQPIMNILWPVFAGLALVCLVLSLVWKNRIVRAICPYAAAVFFLFALTLFLFLQFWGSSIATFLCILNAAVYCLYIVYELYRMEFFLVSFITVLAGVSFYLGVHGFDLNPQTILSAALLVVAIALTVVLATIAGKNRGTIPLLGMRFRVFGERFNPLMLYITCGFWLICFLVALLLGARFAYYCMFAAVAYELVAAVYYTFQLK